MSLLIRLYDDKDHDSVIQLWNECGLVVPWNDPKQEIALKVSVRDELFVVGELEGEVVATVMAGYDGHRGWLYLVGVLPQYQGRGFGRLMIEDVVERLKSMGCKKVNLQIRESNLKVRSFYENLGFRNDNVIGMGLRLQPANPEEPAQ